MKAFHSTFAGLLFLIFSTASAQPGRLDESFGNQGTVVFPITNETEMSYDICVQQDGKIVAGGLQEEAGNRHFFVVRYLEDGSPDVGFGNDGTVAVDFEGYPSEIWALAIQDDGKIILGGSVTAPYPINDNFAIARLNTDGTLDESFGFNGIRSFDVNQGWDNAYGLAIQDDGKIILAGDGYTNNRRCVCAFRLFSDGSLDKGFGNGGVFVEAIGTVEDRTRAVALQDDGKLLLCGYTNDGADDQTLVVRLNTDGTLDNTFGNGGKATLDIGGNQDRLNSIIYLNNGKILSGGFTRDGDLNDFLLVQYLDDGSLDNTFGSNGIKLLNFNTVDIIMELAVQEDGKIVFAGGGTIFQLIRCLDDGAPDISFGVDGQVLTSINSLSIAESIALYGADAAILGGQSQIDGKYNFCLAKYLLNDNSAIQDPEIGNVKLKAYPNPARDKVFVSYELMSDQAISIDLISLDGKRIVSLMSNAKAQAGTHIDELILKEGVPPGIYLLRLLSEKGQSLQKLIIQ